jgi:hypothetical protein
VDIQDIVEEKKSTKMSTITPSTSLTLLGAIKLKGEENWLLWKELMENLAKSNNLRKYIHEKGKAPEFANEFDDDVEATKLKK